VPVDTALDFMQIAIQSRRGCAEKEALNNAGSHQDHHERRSPEKGVKQTVNREIL
jgi:hypothetical protein